MTVAVRLFQSSESNFQKRYGPTWIVDHRRVYMRMTGIEATSTGSSGGCNIAWQLSGFFFIAGLAVTVFLGLDGAFKIAGLAIVFFFIVGLAAVVFFIAGLATAVFVIAGF